MKNRSIKLMAVGLSAALLSGPISMTAYAETVDSPEETQAPEVQEEVVESVESNESNEAALEEQVSDLSEQLNTVLETTVQIVEDTATVVDAFEDQELQQEDAKSLISDASKAVEETTVEFQAAEERYNQVMDEYQVARSEYDAAVAEYNANLDEAQSSLEEAETNLQEAKEKVDDLEKQADAALNDLIDAGNKVVSTANEYINPQTPKEESPKKETSSDEKKEGVLGARREKEDESGAKKSETSTGSPASVVVTPPVQEYLAVLDYYRQVLDSLQTARNEYNAAKAKVQEISQRIDSLKEDESILSLVEITFLEAKLDDAKTTYSEAKDNLASANKNLEDAKTKYSDRFDKSQEPLPAVEPISESGGESQETELTQEEKELLEKELKEKELLEEEKEAEEDITVIQSQPASSGSSSSHHSEESAAPRMDKGLLKLEEPVPVEEIAQPEQLPEDTNKVHTIIKSIKDKAKKPEGITNRPDSKYIADNGLTIADEATPKDITVSGLVQHKKWFVALGGIFIAGAALAVAEIKRRAATRIIDKLNQ